MCKLFAIETNSADQILEVLLINRHISAGGDKERKCWTVGRTTEVLPSSGLVDAQESNVVRWDDRPCHSPTTKEIFT